MDGPALRGRAIEQLDLQGAVGYVDPSDSVDDTSLDRGVRWNCGG